MGKGARDSHLLQSLAQLIRPVNRQPGRIVDGRNHAFCAGHLGNVGQQPGDAGVLRQAQDQIGGGKHGRKQVVQGFDPVGQHGRQGPLLHSPMLGRAAAEVIGDALTIQALRDHQHLELGLQFDRLDRFDQRLDAGRLGFALIVDVDVVVVEREADEFEAGAFAQHLRKDRLGGAVYVHDDDVEAQAGDASQRLVRRKNADDLQPGLAVDETHHAFGKERMIRDDENAALVHRQCCFDYRRGARVVSMTRQKRMDAEA